MTAHPRTRQPPDGHRTLRPSPPDVVRRWIADRLAPARGDPARLGEIDLMPHQREAVARLQAMLSEHGGALLADDPGLGKTFVALAVAAAQGGGCVVAPAALRGMWQSAARRAGVAVPFVSAESLSRGVVMQGSEPLVIVDESHHFRNRTTRRWQQLASRCMHSRVLLLTATPLHNHEGEIRAQLALFLGARAFTIPDDALATHVVRRTREVVTGGAALPRVDGPRWLPVAADDGPLLDAILRLPPPVPPSDGGLAGALVQWTLVRQWSSSRAALAGALRRRIAQAAAMKRSLEQGIHPGRRDLAAWQCGDDAMQLAIPELLGSPAAHAPDILLEAVARHEAALATIGALCHELPDPDPLRVAALRELRATHPRATIIAFAERAETVQRLWFLLRGERGVALLTGTGGKVAGGAVSRRDLLARTAPVAQGVTAPRAAEEVSLLLTTDLLSEGVNLQDASLVVHLDLPWSPARMEQRVGRVRRIGSPHLVVSVWAFEPPAAAERLLDVERRLREKLALAGRLVGFAGSILPGLHAPAGMSGPESWSALLERIRGWRDGRGVAPHSGDAPFVAMVEAPVAGAIALVEREGVTPRLVAVGADGRAMTSLADLSGAVAHAGGAATEWSPRLASEALCRIERSLIRGRVAGSIGATAESPRLHRAIGARIERSLAAVPRHERAAALPLASAARRLLAGRLTAGAERVLGALLDSPLPPAPWLRALAAFADAALATSPRGPRERPEPSPERVTALVVFRPTLPSSPA